MGIKVNHAYEAQGANNPHKQVSVDRWNEDHSITGDPNTVLTFDGTGEAVNTPIEEVGGQFEKTRAELIAITAPAAGQTQYLSEGDRSGIFEWVTGNQSTKVTADPTASIYIPATSNPTGSTGAWRRRFNGHVNVRWFGAVGDNTTNDGAAFIAAIAYLKAVRVTSPTFGYGGGGSGDLFIPAGVYFLGTNTLDISHTLRIIGESNGHTGSASTVLRWSAGATGIRVHAYNTTGATGVISGAAGGDPAGSGSSIENLFLQGGYVTDAATPEGEFHGIHLRGMATIKDVYIAKFQGDGLYGLASAGLGAPVEGNANLTRVTNLTVQSCRNGIFLDGADSNACTFIAPNLIANRMWGIWDSSFLGNSYIGGHAAANGWDGAIGSIPTACTFGGNRYYVRPGQAAGASTNAPTGTTASNTWWGYISAGGTYNGIVAWVSGTTFREGGSYKTDGPNARNVFVGCYAESDSNPAQIVAPSVMVGGLLDNHGTSVNLSSENDGGLRLGKRIGPPSVDNFFYLDTTNFGSLLVGRRFDAGVGTEIARLWMSFGNGTIYDVNNAGWAHIFRVGGANKARLDATGFKLNADGMALGYATGAGGAVTQATDKATGVTLNKVCGQVTMNAAALAANTAVSFTLTNSQIAATDVVNISIGSGATAGAYVVTVDQVSAGSCRISVRNMTGGSLSEALVLNFAVLKAVTA